jgi:tape measure domain-containing protein
VDNNNGALSFDVLIKDNNIDEMLSKDEQRIMEFAGNVEGESQSIVSSFQNIGKTIAGLAITATLKSWVQDIINVRGEFQQLEIAFGTMLGSAEQASTLMKQLTNTAATTPFDLKGVANSAKQLLAYGESAENVNDTLIRLGNIASGLSIPLNDLTYLYGTTMVQGRLFTQDVRQFMGRGIPLVQELSKALGKTTDEINQMVTDGKIGFEEVKLVLNNLTNQGGMFYGLMEQQSKSLTGQISNLEDAWDMMLNEIGQNSEGVLSGGISAVSSLVENYDKCLQVLGTLVTLYGTYKVAVATLAVAQNKSTGITLIDNIALKARAGLFTANVQGGMQVVRTSQQMTAAQQAYTVELQKALTTEQQEQLLRNVRVAAMRELLTAEQQLYMSRLNLTTGSVEYVAAMESLLTADQRAALAKRNLTQTGTAYSVAVQQSVAATQSEVQAQMAATRQEAAALKQKQALLLEEYRASQNKIEQTRVQIALAQQEGNTTAVATLKQQQYNQLQQHAVIVKNMAATATAKEAATEKMATLAKQQGALASKQQVASDTLLATTKGILSTATKGLITSLKSLWATMIANPITAIISLVGLAASAFIMFGKRTEEETTLQGEFQESLQETYGKLNTYFAVLQNIESSSKAYQDALSQINTLCSEHHVELLKENAALDDQIAKHDELIEKIEQTTAAKLQAKYTEQAMQEMTDATTKAMDELKEAAEDAEHVVLEMTTKTNPETGLPEYVYGTVEKASENIRNASESLWEGVITMATDGSKQLAGLTGDAYTEAYNKLVSSITKAVQDATGAGKEEMEAFKPSIEEAIQSTVKAGQEAQQQVQQVNAQVQALFASWGQSFNPQPVQEDVLSTNSSFEELQKAADEAQKEIDRINNTEANVKVNSTELDDALEKLQRMQRLITMKEEGLNTENGISQRIKDLKALRAEAVIGSKEWKEYDARISKLEGKLPSTHKAAASAANKAAKQAEKAADAQQQAGQKAIEVELEVEEKRIAAIKDGYEKRKAELELEHKQELARIDKEQQELEKAYKKGGKSMPTEVSGNFDSLRNYENASYETKQAQLLHTEMEERKKQYEQYYKWVSSYGESVANEQYAKLIEQGKTYEEWLNGKVAELSGKMNSGNGLSTEEGNTLISMQGELDSIHGVTSAMDSFNESLSKAKDNAKTAGDYIANLAAKKAELQQGKTNLIGEDRAQAIAQIDKEIATQTEQLQNQLLEKYKSNAELREDVEREYQQEITWLQQHGYEEQAALAEMARVKAVSELQSEQIQGTDIWRQLFNNAQYLSGKAFTNIKEQLRKMIEQIEDSNIKDALLDQLDSLERETQGSKNPFKQLVNSIKEYQQAGDGTAEKKQKLVNMLGDVGSAADMCKQSFDSIVDGLKKLGLAGDEETQAMLGDISEMMGGISQLSKGISSGDPTAIISGGVSLITSAISLFDSTSRRIKREMKQHQKQLTVLQRMYSQVQYEVENSVGENYYTNQQKAIENLKQQQEEYQELARLEQSKKKKDRDDNKVQEYLASAEDAARQIEDIETEIRETLVQTSFKDLANDLADAWAEAFSDMEDSAESFDEIWNETISNAVKNSLKLKIIEPVVSDFTNALADYMGAHNNSVAGFDFTKWKTMLKNAGTKFTEGLQGFEEFFQDLDDSVSDASETLEGQVSSVSETTASKVAGEMTTMRIRQYEQLVVQQNIEAACVQATAAIRSCIGTLQTIAHNTSHNSELVTIRQQLVELNQKIDSDPLRAKGINY